MRYLYFLLAGLLLGCNGRMPEILPEDSLTTVVYKELAGVEPDLLSLDVYHAEVVDELHPVVVWVHGGAWAIGDKRNQIDDKISLFRSAGYVFVSVNYRLSPFPEELDNPDRVRYPDHNHDVADALRWVVDSIGRYGGDGSKIALMGHSAGAHLVSLTGTRASFLQAVGLDLTNIRGVASIDTEGYDVGAKVGDGVEAYINAFGDDIIANREASPLYNIEPGVEYPRFFVAKRGSAARIGVADAFIGALEGQGVLVDQVDGSVYDHGGINRAIGDADETLITMPLMRFFEDCFQ